MSGINEVFRIGGWGMYPTLVFGLLMIGVAFWYAVRPERRLVPLLVSCGLMTFVSGCLGFCTGVVKSLTAMGQAPPEKHFYSLIGVGESLANIVFAFVLIMLALLAISAGALRVARSLPDTGQPVPDRASPT
jgi:hypothetical protein